MEKAIERVGIKQQRSSGWLHLNNHAYRRQCEGLEGGSLPRFVSRPLRVSAAVTEKSVAPANIPFFFFFFSKGAFPFLSYCYATVDREPPQETIPFSSTRMRSSPSTDYLNGQRKATERKEKNKNQSSPWTGSRRYHSTR